MTSTLTRHVEGQDDPRVVPPAPVAEHGPAAVDIDSVTKVFGIRGRRLWHHPRVVVALAGRTGQHTGHRVVPQSWPTPAAETAVLPSALRTEFKIRRSKMPFRSGADLSSPACTA